MNIRLPLTLAGFALGLVLPTFAEQKNTADQKVEQQIRALAQEYDDAINRHDAVAVAALFTQDGVGQIPESKVSAGHGRQGIEKAYAHWFKNWQVRNYSSTVDRVVTVGNEIHSTGRWSDTFQGIEGGATSFEGHYSWVIAREGDTWKIRKSTCSGYFTG
jgi:uncharacterized protein (TIGR02246 family)